MSLIRREKPLLSIVMATYNRCDRLAQCLDRIHENVRIDHELVVVDGASQDDTFELLARRPEIQLIREARREGIARACNKGFKAARGQYVMWLHDDAYPLPGAVEAALATLERPDLADSAGMLAFYHNLDTPADSAELIKHDDITYGLPHLDGWPVARFGLLRRDLLEQLDWLDERYFYCAWDADLSLKVQRDAGLKVVNCPDALIRHEEVIDARKSEDLWIANEDREKLHAKWNLPQEPATRRSPLREKVLN